eukprot:Transcript_29806.p1 GENE.Transcript_29806~~Transcript_29806.p1  ORF type:complete len:175 (+),score=68.24 Transcript_29806:298-822(+)
MFSSNSIGVSSHKNEYAAGVRIGNWVEEQFGREAEGAADSLKAFMAAQEAAAIAASSTVGRAARADPKQPVDGTMLFSHGPEFGGKYQASSYALHFTDPASRVYGADSGDRVHKSFFWGNKHIDLRHAPKVEPNPRMALMASKAPEWNASKAQLQPYDAGMYTSTAKGAWGKGC